MAEFPKFPLWTDAYLGDTTHLTTIEHGAYLLLLMTMWRTPEKRLKNDDRLLARYTRLSPSQWARMKPIILDFFQIVDGHLYQSRLTDEANAVKRHLQSQSEKGRLSALKRKERHSTVVKSGSNRIQPTTPTPKTLSHSNECDSQSANFELEAEEQEELIPTVKPEHFVEIWNETAKRINRPTILDLTPERRVLLKARINGYSIAQFQTVLKKIEASAFLRGERKWSGVTFDWIITKKNFQKVLEGNYDR